MSTAEYDPLRGALAWIRRNPEAWNIMVKLAIREAMAERRISGKRLVRLARAQVPGLKCSALFERHIAAIMATAFPALAPYLIAKGGESWPR